VSSITGPRGARLDEAWLQHNFLGNRLSLLGGRYDLNGEFYRLHSAALFLNSSFGMGPEFSHSGPADRRFFRAPRSPPASNTRRRPTLVLRAALLNATPYNRAGRTRRRANGNGMLVVSEAAYSRGRETRSRGTGGCAPGASRELTPYDDKYAIGLWRYTASFEDLTRRRRAANPCSIAARAAAICSSTAC